MTTEELFTAEKITLELLDYRSDESEYWMSCSNFITQKWNEDIERMTQKQAAWLDKILEDMVEWRIKKRMG